MGGVGAEIVWFGVAKVEGNGDEVVFAAGDGRFDGVGGVGVMVAGGGMD